jgi:hypothetical protein
MGIRMKLESFHNSEDKLKWKVIRTDTYTEIEGEIIEADEDTGECNVSINGETRKFDLGQGGIKIIPRR